jgi:ribosomal protein L11 methyltransferase
MLTHDTLLFIYELSGDPGAELPTPPGSFVGLWNEDEFSYLFFTEPEDRYVEQLCGVQGGTLNSRHEMAYGDWQAGLPQGGLTIGGVSFVAPDHPSPGPDSIVLDPSVVFGDGAHPTTLACIRAMRLAVDAGFVSSLLDLGTGSGILALAGARMGIPHIDAVDKNRLAVETASGNVRRNSLDSIIRVFSGEAGWFVDGPYDLVAANLPYQVLRDLAVLRGVDRHACWIISGINSEQALVLEGLFQDQGYRKALLFRDPPWVTFAMVSRTLPITLSDDEIV